MAVYQYIAKDGAGREFSGVYTDIEDVTGLREELAKISCVLLKAHRKKTKAVKNKAIKRSEVVTFAYKFAGMYSAGLPILSCLETLEEQAENQAFKHVTAEIRRSIQIGSNLKDACAEHRHVFSDFFLGMIEAGESSGKLGTTLEMSAQHMEKQEDIKRKVVSAFAYPVIVTIMCLAAIVFLLVFVMPTFVKLYNQSHMLLPLATRILIGLSHGITRYWWAIFIVVSGLITTVRWLLRKPHVRLRWDSFKLNMPVFAKLNRMLVVSHFTRTFAMLTSVGVSMVEALHLAGAVAHNRKFSEITEKLEEMIKAGTPVAKSFKKCAIFPPMITEMAASGEQAGQLPKMLNKGSDLLDKDIDRAINALLTRLEPILTIVMGIIVGLILIGAYLPMFDYMGKME